MLKIIGALICANLGISIFNHLKLKKIMNKQERLNSGLDKLDAATNEIAADLKKLKEEVAAGTVSDESMARLDRNVATLEQMGADDVEDGEETTDDSQG